MSDLEYIISKLRFLAPSADQQFLHDIAMDIIYRLAKSDAEKPR